MNVIFLPGSTIQVIYNYTVSTEMSKTYTQKHTGQLGNVHKELDCKEFDALCFTLVQDSEAASFHLNVFLWQLKAL